MTTDAGGIITGSTDPSDIRVWIGDHNLDTTGETSLAEKQLDVVNYFIHENYISTVGESSYIAGPPVITVIELSESVDLEIYTPACMAKNNDFSTFDGKTATVAGWGVTAEGGQFPDPLVPHEVNLPVLPAAECPGWNGSLSDICAGGEGGKDSCQVRFIVISRDDNRECTRI